MLLGGLSVGALTACAPESNSRAEPRISSESVYTNDYFVQSVGYYHAPFHGFYPRPYNYFDPQRKQYFYGGQWGNEPYRSVINISAPTPAAALAAESILAATTVQRGGFGSTSSGFHVWS
ncbi:MAG TPA: hypothetical protein VGM64_16190 [Lacunisphaera sp.]|jgi:hypothetical protein